MSKEVFKGLEKIGAVPCVYTGKAKAVDQYYYSCLISERNSQEIAEFLLRFSSRVESFGRELVGVEVFLHYFDGEESLLKIGDYIVFSISVASFNDFRLLTEEKFNGYMDVL